MKTNNKRLLALVSILLALALVTGVWAITTQVKTETQPPVEPTWTTWTYETVDSTGDVGRDTSIAVDSANGLHICYYDATNLDLKYAYKPDGGTWSTYTIDSTNDVGQYTSIAIDSSGFVYISYYDVTFGDLKYAKSDNAIPEFSTVVVPLVATIALFWVFWKRRKRE